LFAKTLATLYVRIDIVLWPPFMLGSTLCTRMEKADIIPSCHYYDGRFGHIKLA
jgi:hypothetical protein